VRGNWTVTAKGQRSKEEKEVPLLLPSFAFFASKICKKKKPLQFGAACVYRVTPSGFEPLT
jgi:hypothetical protein